MRDQRSTLRRAMAAAAAAMIATDSAAAAVWQWGCTGALGGDQVAFNHERLQIIAGKAPAGRLDDIVQRDAFPTGAKGPAGARTIIATYLAEDANSGLGATMTFKGEAPEPRLTLTLTELTSKKTGHVARLAHGCRDETIDRFRKTYRLERDNAPPQTVTLVCMEYQLSTRGGRTCR